MKPNFVVVFILFTFSSCNKNVAESSKASEGMPGEILVIAEEDALEAVKDAFTTAYTVRDSNLILAERADARQYEKHHAIWFANPESIEGIESQSPVILLFGDAGDYTDHLKNATSVKEIPTSLGYRLRVFRNVWAKPQTVFHLQPEKDLTAVQILEKDGGKFLDSIIYSYEIAQGLPGNLAPNQYTDSVSTLISKNYGFTFRFPPQFRLALSNQEIVWLHHETLKYYRGIFINIFPDTIALNTSDQAVQNRDQFSTKYIHNAEGTKVKVSSSSLFPVTFEPKIKVGNNEAKVLRGWYQEEGTFRRGPFVRYIFHDAANKRCIALDGFLYAPEMERLQFYRLFDLIAGTFELPK